MGVGARHDEARGAEKGTEQRRVEGRLAKRIRVRDGDLADERRVVEVKIARWADKEEVVWRRGRGRGILFLKGR